jgi:ribosomal protein S18 acetylase RimI-like enzyme
VLTGSPDQLFASLEAGGAVIGVARVAFSHTWAGVSALHVAPDHRRTGVAGQLIGALADASRARGIRSMYLQVVEANSPARSLCARLGFSTHHEYRYLGRRPAGWGGRGYGQAVTPDEVASTPPIFLASVMPTSRTVRGNTPEPRLNGPRS